MAREPINLINNVTPISEATRAEQRRRHARSRVVGRLTAIFEQLCATTQKARELGEDLNDPILRELGGRNQVAEGSPLHDATMAVCRSIFDVRDAAEPDPKFRRNTSGDSQ